MSLNIVETYTVLTKDHSRYENPHYGDLGSPTNPSLAWWSWGSTNQQGYRKDLFAMAETIGAKVANIEDSALFRTAKEKVAETVSFSVYGYMNNGELGTLLINKDSTPGYASAPCTRHGLQEMGHLDLVQRRY